MIEIFTDRLLLRDVTIDDSNNLHELFSLPEIEQFNSIEKPNSIHETINEINLMLEEQSQDKRKNYSFCIINKDQKYFIGFIGMNLFADRFKLAKIFFMINPNHWDNGYATEAAKSIIDFGFKTLFLHRIEAGADIENKRSVRVLEKCKMMNEGIRRSLLPVKGKWKDCFHFAIIESDPRNY
jgi:[ribosomal protein S5]-alanine N-acetyltransferase